MLLIDSDLHRYETMSPQAETAVLDSILGSWERFLASFLEFEANRGRLTGSRLRADLVKVGLLAAFVACSE